MSKSFHTSFDYTRKPIEVAIGVLPSLVISCNDYLLHTAGDHPLRFLITSLVDT